MRVNKGSRNGEERTHVEDMMDKNECFNNSYKWGRKAIRRKNTDMVLAHILKLTP